MMLAAFRKGHAALARCNLTLAVTLSARSVTRSREARCPWVLHRATHPLSYYSTSVTTSSNIPPTATTSSSAELTAYLETHGTSFIQSKKGTGKVTCRALNQGIKRLLRDDQPLLALQLFGSMQERWNIVPDAFSYASALTALDRLHRWQDAIALFEQLEDLGIAKDTVMYNTALHILGKAGQWHHAYSLYRELGPRADSFSRQSILAALSNRGPQMQLLAQLKAEFAAEEREYQQEHAAQKEYIDDAYHEPAEERGKGMVRRQPYSQYLDFSEMNRRAIACADYGPAVEELTACIRKKDLGLLSSPGALTEAFKLFGNAHRADMVLSLLNCLQEQDLPLSTQNANNAMNALLRSNSASEAINLFENMESQWKLQPDAHSCGTAISAYDMSGRWQDGAAVYLRLGVLGLPKDRVIYSNMIKMLGAAGQWRQAYGVFREMGPLADTAAQQAILRCMQSAAQPKIYESLQKEFLLAAQQRRQAQRQGQGQGSVPSAANAEASATGTGTGTVDFAAIEKDAARCGDYSAAVEAAVAWLEVGKVTPGGLTACFKIFGLAQRPDKVQSLLALLEKLGIKMNTAHCNAAMAAFNRCNESNKTLEMLNIMEPHWGLVPDSYTYAAAFHAYDRTGQWEDALTLFEVLSDRGLVQKNAFLYNAIITVLGNAGKWEKAFLVFREMGQLADHHSRYAICAALEQGNQTQLVQALRAEFGGAKSDAAEGRGRGGRGGALWERTPSEQNGHSERVRRTTDTHSTATSATGRGGGRWGDAISIKDVSSSDISTNTSAALLQKLQERPDIATFLIQFLGMTEQTDAISHVLDDMDAKSLLITGQPGVHLTHTYNTGILACGNAGEAEKAFAIYRRMLSNGVPRTRNTYECLMRVAAAFMGEDDVAYVKKKAEEDRIVISNPYYF